MSDLLTSRRVDGDETWHRLLNWTNGTKASERLSTQILKLEGYSLINPSHPLGGPDGKIDLTCDKDQFKWKGASYFPRGEKTFSEIKRKFLHDFDGMNADFAGIIFVTNQPITVAHRKTLQNLKKHHKVEIYHLERNVHILNNPLGYGVRQEFLKINMTPEEQLAFYAQLTNQMQSGFQQILSSLTPQNKSQLAETHSEITPEGETNSRTRKTNNKDFKFDIITRRLISTKEEYIRTYKYFLIKGLNKKFTRSIESLISRCSHLENYSTLLECLHLKKYLISFKEGLKAFEDIDKKIVFYQYCQKAVSRAADYYYKLVLGPYRNSGLNQFTFHKYLSVAIQELANDYKYTRSGLVGYYLKLLEIPYYSILNDYKTAKQASLDLLAITKQRASVKRKQRIAMAYHYLATSCAYLNQDRKAISFFKLARAKFQPKTLNYLLSIERELICTIRLGEYGNAKRLLTTLHYRSLEMKAPNYFLQKQWYYRCYIEFLENNYINAIAMANEVEFGKNSNIDVFNCLLATMIHFEFGDIDSAREIISKLNTKIKLDQDKKTFISDRNLSIVRFLTKISRQNLSRKNFKKITTEYFSKLSNGDEWNPFSLEIIRFEKWAKRTITLDRFIEQREVNSMFN
jgi:hypothetical protein